MKLSLLVLTAGKQEGKVLEIKLPQFLIGRDPQCQLRPASPLISKRHCAILQRDGLVFVRDFESTNGTFVNDEPVAGEREVVHGDQLKIGPIHFTVQIDAKAMPSATPAPPTKGVAAKPASKSDTPLPATAAAESDASEADDIAAMLMEMDESERAAGGGIPDGSTVFDLKVPPEGGEAKPGDDKGKAPAKAASGDTRSAAARILDKMTKRPRT